MRTEPMVNPELNQYRQQLLDIRAEIIRFENVLSMESFEWRPAEDAWSIAMVFDHLNKIGYQLLPAINKAIAKGEEKEWFAEGPFHYSYLGRKWVELNGPDKIRKTKSPKLYQPESGQSFKETITRLKTLQDYMLESIKNSNGLDLKRIKVSSPANRLLRFSLGIWYQTIIAHQQRHLLQANRILERFNSKQTESSVEL